MPLGVRPGRLDSWGDLATLGLPILFGWGTYRFVRWRMLPPTRPALPAGQGFEVLPAGTGRRTDGEAGR